MFDRAEPMVSQNKCSLELTNRTNVPNKYSHGQAITCGYRTNVRLRQDPISGLEICKPNKCSSADTAADIVPHARPEDKSRDRNQNTRRTCRTSGTKCRTRGTGCTRQTCRPSSDRMQNTRKGSGTMKRGNAAQANIMPLELILKQFATIYTLKH